MQIKLFVFPQEYSVSEFSRIFENVFFQDLLDFVRLKVVSDFFGERDYLSFVFPPGLPHSEHLEKFRLGIYPSTRLLLTTKILSFRKKNFVKIRP